MESTDNIDWKSKNIVKISNEFFNINDEVDERESRRKIEPWLTSIFQSDHLSLLVGSGLTTAVTSSVGLISQGMERIDFEPYKDKIKKWADKQARTMDREKANFEDDLRVAMDFLQGLRIIEDKKVKDLEIDINYKLGKFIENILKGEKDFIEKNNQDSINYLKSFLISFASRTATRDRLNIFTTNYDRFIEYGCDLAGILILDRFIGKIKPEFRTTRLELDYHYNPPGIRGEPRYVEGVVRLTKLHGSIDWCFEKRNIQKLPIAFGANKLDDEILKSPLGCAVIYPNSLKCLETAFYPYSELFRDFSSTICRPNSVVVTYGYGFGDSHINRILQDMLTIPSTHIVIVSYDKSSDRIQKFYEYNNKAQITLLMGNHFGDLIELVDNYLPKAAIDRITQRMQNILERRGNQGFSELNKMNGEKKDET
jgi:hypothetical protein